MSIDRHDIGWPSDVAIARRDRGPRGVPARARSVSVPQDDALTVTIDEQTGTSRKFLIDVESARFLAAALDDMIELYDGTRRHSSMSSGIPSTEGSPAEGQQHVPPASASAADEAE